jgi:hypothetical protein
VLLGVVIGFVLGLDDISQRQVTCCSVQELLDINCLGNHGLRGLLTYLANNGG